MITEPLRITNTKRMRARCNAVALCGALSLAALEPTLATAHEERTFRRIANFPVYLNTDIETETVSEIVTATEDGMFLIYTDSANGALGFVDIVDPEAPLPAGMVALGGQPTSVGVAGDYALVAVDTSVSFVEPSGQLIVVDIDNRSIVATFELGGQPDSVAVSPDRRYAAIAIENQRDEDLGDGRPPQAPPGFLVIVDLVGDPTDWALRNVDLVGVPDLFPEDPEPEYVDIDHKNRAVVTMQENNHIAVIRLKNGRIVRDFPAGTVDLQNVDVLENELIEPVDSLFDIPREADAVTWLGKNRFATADEGDLDGGSRGFTIYHKNGGIRFEVGNDFEHMTMRIGHYPEDRSENKGSEPEGVEYARYGKQGYLFVGSERSSVIGVYELARGQVEFLQVLPASVGPEGLLAIPERDLFVVASEEDDRGDGFRSAITIYRLEESEPSYPTIVSGDRAPGEPLPWAALSGLAADPQDESLVYAVHDSFLRESRIFVIDASSFPARILDEIVLRDENDLPVDLDLEGIAVGEDGTFWVVSEGSGSVDDPDRPVTSFDTVLQVSSDGAILKTLRLPEDVDALQRRFGFEGIALDQRGDGDQEGSSLYVAFQREWVDDPDGLVRIGRYDREHESWAFYYYPIDEPTSPNGGWVGLSELVSLGDGEFAVIERDNQAGDDARLKAIYAFSIEGLEPGAQGEEFPIVEKELVRDLIPDLAATQGQVLEKVEGMTVLEGGDVVIVTDNDGVDDHRGETQWIRIDELLDR